MSEHSWHLIHEDKDDEWPNDYFKMKQLTAEYF